MLYNPSNSFCIIIPSCICILILSAGYLLNGLRLVSFKIISVRSDIYCHIVLFYKKSGFGFLLRLITTLLIQFNIIAKPTNQPFSLATSNSCFICARSSGLTRTSHIESAIIFAAYTMALCAASLFPALR